MNRIEYGVRLGWTVKGNDEDYGGRDLPHYGYYEGRDQHGQIKIGKDPNRAAMMTQEVAEQLIERLKTRYPLSEIAELICNERDELTATSLAELGEASTSVAVLQEAIKQCVADGMSRQDIVAVLESVFV